jgi:hypothetical protein
LTDQGNGTLLATILGDGTMLKPFYLVSRKTIEEEFVGFGYEAWRWAMGSQKNGDMNQRTSRNGRRKIAFLIVSAKW